MKVVLVIIDIATFTWLPLLVVSAHTPDAASTEEPKHRAV
jgi:hypothetical protein